MGDAIRKAREARGWSQDRLAAETGSSQSAIQRMEQGDWKRTPDALPRVCSVLGLQLDVGDAAPTPELIQEPRQLPIPQGRETLPVYAAVEAGEGAIMVTTEAVDFAERPQILMRVKDAYGLLVTGDSMVPRYRAGDMVEVHPHLVPRPFDGIVLYSGSLQGEVKATLKEFVRQTPDHWIVRRFHPETRELRLKKSDWPVAHVVTGVRSR